MTKIIVSMCVAGLRERHPAEEPDDRVSGGRDGLEVNPADGAQGGQPALPHDHPRGARQEPGHTGPAAGAATGELVQYGTGPGAATGELVQRGTGPGAATGELVQYRTGPGADTGELVQRGTGPGAATGELVQLKPGAGLALIMRASMSATSGATELMRVTERISTDTSITV